jgi:hypothetical protein
LFFADAADATCAFAELNTGVANRMVTGPPASGTA